MVHKCIVIVIVLVVEQSGVGATVECNTEERRRGRLTREGRSSKYVFSCRMSSHCVGVCVPPHSDNAEFTFHSPTIVKESQHRMERTANEHQRCLCALVLVFVCVTIFVCVVEVCVTTVYCALHTRSIQLTSHSPTHNGPRAKTNRSQPPTNSKSHTQQQETKQEREGGGEEDIEISMQWQSMEEMDLVGLDVE